MKATVIRLSSFGDLVLTAPVFKALKDEGFETTLITKSRFSEIVKHDPNIDNIITAEVLKVFPQPIKTDILLDLQGNLSSIKLYPFIKSKARKKVKKYYLSRFLLTSFKWYTGFPTVISRYMNTLEGVLHKKIVPDDLIYTPGSPPPLNLSYPIITLSLDSKWKTKSYPHTNKLVDLILTKTGLNILVVGDTKAGIDSERVYNVGTHHPIPKTAALVRESLLAVTVDSVWMHLEIGMGIPTIALFGSTHPKLGFVSPHNSPNILLQRDLKCRPCTKIGRKNCPKKHFRCMMDISPEEIMDRIENVIDSRKSS